MGNVSPADCSTDLSTRRQRAPNARSILPGAAIEAEQMPLETMRRHRAAGDPTCLLGAVDVEPGGAPLGAEEPTQSHVDELAPAQRRSAGVGVERLEHVVVDGNGDATAHPGIVRGSDPGASPTAPSGESTSPVGTLG